MTGTNTDWRDEWIHYAKQVMAAGCNMSEASSAINFKFKLDITRSAFIAKILRLKRANQFGKLPKPEIWHHKPIKNLITYWHNGIPTNEIANYFGVEDSTIRHKALEYGLRPRKPKKSEKKVAPVKTTVEPSIVPTPVELVIDWTKGRDTFPNSNAKSVLFEDLTGRMCRFVIGEKPYYFCGAEIEPGSSVPYCGICRKVVYVQPRLWGG